MDGASDKNLGLKHVMTLHPQPMSIQSLSTHVLDKVIGTSAACGYGDGYPVSAQDGTPVLVNDIKCTVVGRVSMDMIAIDLTLNPSAKVGDNVTLWGDNLPIEDVAHYTHDITWRLIFGVSSRIKGVWTDAPHTYDTHKGQNCHPAHQNQHDPSLHINNLFIWTHTDARS